MDKLGWYTWLTWGSDPAPARGPFRSEEDAYEARSRFRRRHGWLAGTYEAAGCVRLGGPYRTRERARDADISGPLSDR